MTMYDDLYVRDNLDDTGVIPSSGLACQSPDIIPFQDGILTWDYASKYYDSDLGEAIINGGVNNIYVRAKNLNSKTACSGKVNLYYTSSSLFPVPSTWTQIESAGGDSSLSLVNGSDSTSISPGGIALSNPSFYLTNLPPISDGAHYCLIAIVQTTAHPVTIPDKFSSNPAFTKWAQDNPAVCFRNITYASNTHTQLMRIFKFGNIAPDPHYFTFIIMGHGFVVGTEINCQCTDEACPINEDSSLPKPDPLGNQVVNFTTSVPANFWGDIVITLTSPSGQFPTGALLSVAYYEVPPSKPDALEKAVARRFITASGIGEESDFTTAMLIKLGESTIRITDNPKKIE